MVGGTREHVTKALGKFVQAGYVSLAYHQVTVHDSQLLTDFATGTP